MKVGGLQRLLFHLTFVVNSRGYLHKTSRYRVRPSPRLFRMSTSAGATSDDPLTGLGLPSPLLLGSASFTRKLILKEMGIPFQVLVRPIDEKSLGDRSNDAPDELVLTVAQAKMDHLIDEIRAGRCHAELNACHHDDSDRSSSSSEREWIVLTGDQVVVCNGQIMEKPHDVHEAQEFVSTYASHPPSTVGSCILTHLPSGIQVSGVDTATIHFTPDVPANLVNQLLADDAPVLSCAGGLMIEHPRVQEHVVRIDGTEDSVMGLSKDLVLRLLQELADSLPKR